MSEAPFAAILRMYVSAREALPLPCPRASSLLLPVVHSELWNTHCHGCFRGVDELPQNKRTKPLQLCSRCGVARYCSAACQVSCAPTPVGLRGGGDGCIMAACGRRWIGLTISTNVALWSLQSAIAQWKQTQTCCWHGCIGAGGFWRQWRLCGCVSCCLAPPVHTSGCLLPYSKKTKGRAYEDFGFEDLVDSCSPTLDAAAVADVVEQLPFVNCYCKVRSSMRLGLRWRVSL